MDSVTRKPGPNFEPIDVDLEVNIPLHFVTNNGAFFNLSGGPKHQTLILGGNTQKFDCAFLGDTVKRGKKSHFITTPRR